MNLDFYRAAQDQLPGVTAGTAANPESGFGMYLSGIFSAVMVIAALLVMMYLIWGAIDWITANGESSKIQKARDKMTQAIIGLIVLASTVAIFVVIQRFLGIQVLNFGGTGSTGGGSGTGTTTGSGSGAGSGSCARGIAIDQIVNDGGAGGYCTGGGAARVKCVSSTSSIPYPHFEPCNCTSGSPKSGYTFMSC